ncbi:unnamed protein product, partial [Ectocarpus sp. 4 AP-2014]
FRFCQIGQTTSLGIVKRNRVRSSLWKSYVWFVQEQANKIYLADSVAGRQPRRMFLFQVRNEHALSKTYRQLPHSLIIVVRQVDPQGKNQRLFPLLRSERDMRGIRRIMNALRRSLRLEKGSLLLF